MKKPMRNPADIKAVADQHLAQTMKSVSDRNSKLISIDEMELVGRQNSDLLFCSRV